MKKLMILFAFVFLISLASVSADIRLWKTTDVSYNESTIADNGYINLDDSNAEGISRQKEIPIGITWQWQDLPYNITAVKPEYADAYVDWCNLSVRHEKNEYDGEGNYISVTNEYYSQFIENVAGGVNTTFFFIKAQDTLAVSMRCHFTNKASIFPDNTFFGEWYAWYPAFTCKECEETRLEQISQKAKYNEERAKQVVDIYEKIQQIVRYIYLLWLYTSYIIKIAFIIIAVGLIFAGIYFIYQFILRLAKQ